MRPSRLLIALPFVIAAQLTAQAPAPVVMPAGSYIIQARDTAAAPGATGMVGWPLTLKSNGSFTIITMPDSLPLVGKLVQKDGLATITEQTCSDGAGVYFVRKERDGYAFDFKSEACAGREAGWTKLLFVPGKPRR
jgi:hypothetical protein